jgi:hypothetical protein
MGFLGTMTMKVFRKFFEVLQVMLKYGIALGIYEERPVTRLGPEFEIAIPLTLIFNKIKRIIRLALTETYESKQENEQGDYG